MNFLDLIKSNGYMTVSKELAREIGLNESIILSELISQYKYFKEQNDLDEEGFFYCTVDKMEHHTTLKEDTQRKAIKNLVKLDLIEQELKGLPAKRHFKIKEMNVIKLLSGDEYEVQKSDNPRDGQIPKKPGTGSSKNPEQEPGKNRNIHNNNYNNIEEEERAHTRKEKNQTNQNENKLSSTVIEKFREVFDRSPTNFDKKQLSSTGCKEKLLIKALEMTGLNSKNLSIGYTIALLADWTSKGLRTAQEVKEMIEEYRNSSGNSKSKKKNKTSSTTGRMSMEELYQIGYK